MGRKSTIHEYIRKRLNGITILEPLDIRDGRLFVKCLCHKCGKRFEAKFHNVYKGNYSSCGCSQFGFRENSCRWSGCGEISKSYFGSLQRGAKSRNLDFDVSIEQIWELYLKQNKQCALSGLDIGFADSRRSLNKTASLDRKDSKKGYTIDNIQWVHVDINYMKQSLSDKEFLNLVNIIHKFQHE